MDKIRAGIVGLQRGNGITHSLQMHPQVEITALCDINTHRLSEIARTFSVADDHLYDNYDNFLNADLDVVVIATPIQIHAEQSIAAMESGKHVLCEQTAAYTIEDCTLLVETVNRTGLKYMMAENYTYFHYIRQWKEQVDQGKLGKIFYAEGEYIHEIVNLLIDPVTKERHWRYTRPPIYYCAHTLGPLLTLMDDRIVKATGVHSGKNIYPQEEGLGFLDMEVGLFQTEKGAVIKILRSQTAPRHHEVIFYSLYGTKGCIESGRNRTEGYGSSRGLMYIEGETSRETGAVEIDCPVVDPDAPEEARKGGHGTSELYMVNDFIGSIQNNTKPPIDVIRSIEFTIPGIIAHESAMRGGEWLDVPQFR
ncbi:MAG: Gfo/Idh/MocA family oxidoreductase [Anaerolineae bacterium]|nr:Gfo/Idh/MocA family oxidoreductase [Anaerolineae bacterium]